MLKKCLSFNDVTLVPRYSPLVSRSEADLSTKVAGLSLRIPIIAANMSSVCETDMAIAVGQIGGLGIIHRMCSPVQQCKMLSDVKLKNSGIPVGFSIGIGEDWRERMAYCKAYADIACLDIAHAHHKRVIEILHQYFKIYKNFPIIIGQICTVSAVRDLLAIIPEQFHQFVAFKTSIGGGSLCTTRIKTGFGIPTLQSIMNIAELFPNISLIGDGGIKDSGDIVKSLAAGADAVMLGSLLAGTEEAPGSIVKTQDKLYKAYRGSASFGDKVLRGDETNNVEGEESLVQYKGPVQGIIKKLLDGVRSGFSYGGATNIRELQENVEFQEITMNGWQESLPHGKY